MNMDEKLHFADFSDRLLDWYADAARDLPWRVGPAARSNGTRPDPYRVWMAEIMLQQTTVPHATRYFHAFTERWPTIEALAGAKDEDVMGAWAGLGYYARARNLLKCAREVTVLGAWPDTVKGLRALPGIGPYTAGAIAALAFDRRAAAVDGNVDRVFARMMALKGEWKLEKERLKKVVEALVPSDRPAEFAEALMDLGATICTPRSPNCLMCPVMSYCLAQSEGTPTRYPIKPKKTPKPQRTGHVYVLYGTGRTVLTERRPERGLLGGMMGLPTSDWIGELKAPKFPSEGNWEALGEVRHVFTHFSLTLKVWRSEQAEYGAETPVALAADSLPSVFAKALKLAL